MAAVIGSVAAVNVFLESDEDDDLEDITTSPAIISFFNIQLNKMIFEKSCPLRFLQPFDSFLNNCSK